MSKEIVIREIMPANYKDTDREADDLYLRCRNKFIFFKHKKAVEMAKFVAREIGRVMEWQSPSYKLNKMKVLQDYWRGIDESLDRIK